MLSVKFLTSVEHFSIEFEKDLPKDFPKIVFETFYSYETIKEVVERILKIL